MIHSGRGEVNLKLRTDCSLRVACFPLRVRPVDFHGYEDSRRRLLGYDTV
jgi:hypothetical protein